MEYQHKYLLINNTFENIENVYLANQILHLKCVY